MDLGITGRHALVTGAGRGLGHAIAKCLAREGAIIAAVSRTVEDIERLVEEIGGADAGHRAVPMDLTPEGAPVDLIHQLRDFGPLDIVVHNIGGTLNITDPFCTIEDWRRVYRFNFEVAVELNNMFLPEMKRRKWGRVVHISSIAGMENQGPVTYCAMKAALTAYTRSIGGVVASDGVVVSAILPGAIFAKDGYWDITSRERPEHVQRFLTERQRIGRFGRPEEIGNLVAFFCSELASFNTGSIVPADGGQGRGYFGQ